jgi:hypothetical protein
VARTPFPKQLTAVRLGAKLTKPSLAVFVLGLPGLAIWLQLMASKGLAQARRGAVNRSGLQVVLGTAVLQ